jgi:CspA family cold shock protein
MVTISLDGNRVVERQRKCWSVSGKSGIVLRIAVNPSLAGVPAGHGFGRRNTTHDMLACGRRQPGHGTPRTRKRTGDNFAKELAADVAQNGTIKRLVMDRGFGFLSGEDGKEYFFHRSSVEGSFEGLQEGQKVSFDVEASAPKGPRASRVRVA